MTGGSTAAEFAEQWAKVCQRYAHTMRDLQIGMASATGALRKLADELNAEKMRRSLENVLTTWTPDERAEFERLVRRLHAAQPDLSLTDCMLSVGAAMEACR